MSVIDCYFRFEKRDNTKSKTRFDLVFSSESYEPFVQKNKAGEFWIYLAKGSDLKTQSRRKPDLAISTRTGQYLTGIYFPAVEKSNLGFGDFGSDAILILLSEKIIELLICKGKKNILQNLFNLFYDNELDSEIEAFREQTQTLKLVSNAM